MTNDPDLKKRTAEIIAKSWQDALDQNIPGELIASTALSISIGTLVKATGKDATVRIIKRLMDAVEDGRFDH